MSWNDAAGFPTSLTDARARMARRLRLAGAKELTARLASALAAGLAALAAVALWRPALALTLLPWLLGGTGLTLLALLLRNAFRPLPARRLDRLLDRALALPDLALTTGELPSSHPSPPSLWLRLQRLETERALARAARQVLHPARWPRGAGLSCFAVGGLLALFAPVYLEHGIDRRAARQAEAERETARLPIATMFTEWEAGAAEDEALQRLLEQTRPLRERLLAAATEDRERFADLNRLEAVLQAEQARLEAASLEPVAGTLADALEKAGAFRPLCDALRKGDFETAGEAANAAAQALEKPDAKVPDGAREAAESLASTGEKLTRQGNRQAGESLAKVAEGSRKENARQMASGLKGLQTALNRENARRKEMARLQMQMKQLGFCKSCLGGTCQSPFPSLFAKPGGQEAGRGSAPKLPGAETQLAAHRMEESLEGVVGEGESETTTQQTRQGQAEAARGPDAARFQEYARLSEQAVQDESLPLIHRETIKRYFERIRPSDTE